MELLNKRIWKVGMGNMADKNKPKKREDIRKVAPGFNDEKFGEDATREDKKNGNNTKVVRVFLDENDPSAF